MKHLFFLGIAGHTMGGLALAAQNRGYTVSGLDEAAGPPMSGWLDDRGLTWAKTYDPAQLEGVTTVVISGQHGSNDHPLIQAARQKNIPIVSFAQLLGELTQGKHVIAVAGAHGKTTTTSFMTWLLEFAGKQPDYLVGIRPFNFQASSRLAGAGTVVIEADEYKASTLDARPKFDYYHPDVLVLTSVEHDHPDTFPTLQSYINAFAHLVAGLPKKGLLVTCSEDKIAAELAAKAPCPTISYGLKEGDYTARTVTYTPEGVSFVAVAHGKELGHVLVPLYGRHNVLNCLAAIAVAVHEGLSFEQIKSAAAGFKGAFRRFNIVTPPGSAITVIDDYAHHPTEAQATIEAARLHFPGQRLVVVYRPHTYSRTQTLLKEYHQSFSGADALYMTDVEPARELANQRTVSGQEIVDGLPPAVRKQTYFVPDRTDMIARIKEDTKPGDVVLCMTVSGYDDIANELAKTLNA